MRTRFSFAVLVVALVVSSACELFKGGNGSPTSPSPGNPGNGSPVTPPPPGVSFPSLPHTERAVAEDGTVIEKMRATLVSVTPVRGSGIRVPQSNCIDVPCFQAVLEFEFDGFDSNPNVGMTVDGWLSKDGKDLWEKVLNLTMPPGKSGHQKTNTRIFDTMEVPRYFLVKMKHPSSNLQGIPAEEGWAKFELDYRQM